MPERDHLASEYAWMHQVCQRAQLVSWRCDRCSQGASAGVAGTARGATRHDPGARGYLSLPQRASAVSQRSEFFRQRGTRGRQRGTRLAPHGASAARRRERPRPRLDAVRLQMGTPVSPIVDDRQWPDRV